MAETAVISTLVNQATKLSAPFTETAAARLQSELFGAGRAARSSDIVIFNAADVDLHLHRTECQWGGYSTDLFPETEIPSKKSSVYGIESNGFLSGVTCSTTYESEDGKSRVQFLVENYINSTATADLKVIETLGQGNNNQVRFLIKSRNDRG